VLDAIERMGGHKTERSDEDAILGSGERNSGSTTTAKDYLVSADGFEPSTHALKGRGRLSPVAWIHHFRSAPDRPSRRETWLFGA
jgi:hypothetical protein